MFPEYESVNIQADLVTRLPHLELVVTSGHALTTCIILHVSVIYISLSQLHSDRFLRHFSHKHYHDSGLMIFKLNQDEYEHYIVFKLEFMWINVMNFLSYIYDLLRSWRENGLLNCLFIATTALNIYFFPLNKCLLS